MYTWYPLFLLITQPPYLKCSGVSHLRDPLFYLFPGLNIQYISGEGLGRGEGEACMKQDSRSEAWKAASTLSPISPFFCYIFPSCCLSWVLRSVTNGKINCFSNFLTTRLAFSSLEFMQSITLVHLPFTALVL